MNGMITVAKKSNNIDFIKYSYSIGVRDFRLNMDYEKEAYESIELIQSLKLEDAKIFADYQRYIKSKSGQFIVDKNYNPDFEINEQIKLLSNFKY